MFDYSEVSRYSHQFIAEQADFIDPAEMAAARALDETEPEAHKAFRKVLQAHSNIRQQIYEIRWARFLLGRPTKSDARFIEAEHRRGSRVYDPKPQERLTNAGKHLLRSLKSKAEAWARLRDSEAAATQRAIDEAMRGAA